MKPTEAQRRYSLDEIDRMRAAIIATEYSNSYHPHLYQYGVVIGHSSESWERQQSEQARRVEDRLRTCMVGGVGPDELEQKRDLANAACEQRIAEWKQNEVDHALRREYGPRP